MNVNGYDPELDGCLLCDGDLLILGQLGYRVHARCQDCGVEQSFISHEDTPYQNRVDAIKESWENYNHDDHCSSSEYNEGDAYSL